MRAPGKELVPLESPQPETLLDRLFEEALACRDVEHATQCLEMIEHLYPEMHARLGKVRAFVWPEVPEYVPQITAEVIEQRFDNAVASLQTDETTVLQVTPTFAKSERFAELFDDTVTLDPSA